MIETKDNADYAYAVGRVRVLETRLLTRGMVDRMSEAADFDELIRILADSVYGHSLSRRVQYRELLKEEEAQTLALFDELCLDERLTRLLHYQYDFHNVKVLVKSYVAKTEFDYALTGFGSVDTPFLKAAFEEDRLTALPDVLERTVSKALEGYFSRKDPRSIDLVVDREMIEFFRNAAAEIGNPFVSSLLQVVVDLANIRTLARVKRMGEEREIFRLALLEGGVKSHGWYMDLVDQPWEALAQKFYSTPYFRLVEEGYGYLVTERSFRKLEKLCDDFLTTSVRATRYLHFGVEPLIAYFLAKMNELRILRLLFVGKLHGVEADTIRERLPDVF